MKESMKNCYKPLRVSIKHPYTAFGLGAFESTITLELERLGNDV